MTPDLGAWIQHPAVQLVSLSCAVAGVVLAIFFYVKGHRQKSLRYMLCNLTLVEGLACVLRGLEVRFNGVQHNRISILLVKILNHGTETIDGADVVADSPLGLVVSPGADVLGATVVDQSDRSNRLQVHPDLVRAQEDGCQFLPITFDYLDPREGGVIQVVHTGGRRHQFMVAGKVKGGTTISRIASPARTILGDRLMRVLAGSRLFRLFTILACSAIAVGGVALPAAGFGSWWLLLLVPVGGLGAWVVYRGYVMEQVPARHGRRSKMPMTGLRGYRFQRSALRRRRNRALSARAGRARRPAG